MLRRLAPLAVSAVLLAGVTAAGGAAHAETSSVDDVARDVFLVGRDGSRPAEPGERGERSADIRQATLSHGVDRVKAVIRVRNLKGPEDYSPDASAYLRTPDGTDYVVEQSNEDGYQLFRLGDGEPAAVECRITRRSSLESNEISYAFDRGCLDDPEWLRFGATSYNPTMMTTWFVDDARREGVYDGTQRARIGGPRVYAGRQG